MSPDELTAAREAYEYVPAHLIKSSDGTPDLVWGVLQLTRELPAYRDWTNIERRSAYSSVDLDAYHTRLFDQDEDDVLLHALASTRFWGYLSGADGRFHPEYAIERTNWLIRGRRRSPPQQRCEILQWLRAARERLRAGDLGDALLNAMKIKFFKRSFASKVLMFMDPSRAVVYDELIRRFLTNSRDESLTAMAISSSANPKKQAQAYSRWCSYCARRAADMNQKNYTWRDWNGSEQKWRAVDIERAFFSSRQ